MFLFVGGHELAVVQEQQMQFLLLPENVMCFWGKQFGITNIMC